MIWTKMSQRGVSWSMQPTRKSCLCILPASRSRNRILVRRSTLERDIFVSDVEGGGHVEKPITQLRVAFTIISQPLLLCRIDWREVHRADSRRILIRKVSSSRAILLLFLLLPLLFSSNRRPPRLFLSLLLEPNTSSFSSQVKFVIRL